MGTLLRIYTQEQVQRPLPQLVFQNGRVPVDHLQAHVGELPAESGRRRGDQDARPRDVHPQADGPLCILPQVPEPVFQALLQQPHLPVGGQHGLPCWGQGKSGPPLKQEPVLLFQTPDMVAHILLAHHDPLRSPADALLFRHGQKVFQTDIHRSPSLNTTFLFIK